MTTNDKKQQKALLNLQTGKCGTTSYNKHVTVEELQSKHSPAIGYKNNDGHIYIINYQLLSLAAYRIEKHVVHDSKTKIS